MAIGNFERFTRSDYDKEVELAINTAINTISANITTLSANVTTISSSITFNNDFGAITVDATANYTISLASKSNFTVLSADTATKTLKFTNIPTATDTMLDINLKILFSTTATISYTSNITWPAGTAPGPTAVGTIMINLKSFDAGANWFGRFNQLY